MSAGQTGIVTGLYIAPAASVPMQAVDTVAAITGCGLLGDRYYFGTGFYSKRVGWGAQVTLIESEAVAAINAGHQSNFTAAMLRRNIATAGIKLETLIGREFKCGDAVLRGTKAFPPCSHLAKLIGEPRILRYLAYGGGIGAEVIEGGAIQTQNVVLILDNANPTPLNPEKQSD